MSELNEIEEPVSEWMIPRRDVFGKARIRRDRPTPYNTRIEFDRKDLTKAGGYGMFVGFCDRFGLPKLLRQIKITKRRSKYSVLDLNLLMIDLIILGVERISHIDTWGPDALVPALRGHDTLPHSTSLFRHMESYTPENIVQLEKIQGQALKRGMMPDDNAVLDIDSTVITVYGNQERSERGYNPHKKGRPSYNLKVGFINGKEMVAFRLDPGNTVSSSGFESFLNLALSRVPGTTRVQAARLDKGYYSKVNLSLLEERGLEYVVKAPSYPILVQKATELPESAWEDITDKGEASLGIETWVSEFSYQAGDWDRPRRFLVKRVLVEDRGEEGLFEHSGRYEFSFYVTNMEKNPWEVIRFYDARATVENRIKETKLGFNLDKLPSGSFRVNEVYLHFVMLAYNLLWWFKSSLPLGKKLAHRGIRFVREALFLVPGVVKREKEGFVIHLPSGWPFAGLMREIMTILARGAPA